MYANIYLKSLNDSKYWQKIHLLNHFNFGQFTMLIACEHDTFLIFWSDGFVLNGFFGVDDSFLVENSVPADSAFNSVVGFELWLFSAVAFSTNVGNVDQFVFVDLHLFKVDFTYYYKLNIKLNSLALKLSYFVF